MEYSTSDPAELALCNALKNRLNSTSHRKACPIETIDSYPGFRDPPWEILDASQHLSLATKMQEHIQVGPVNYWDEHNKHDAPQYRVRAENFIGGGGGLKMWRAPNLVFLYDNDRYQPAPVSQTVVMMVELGTDSANGCHPASENHRLRYSFLVTSDLLDFDKRAGLTASTLNDSWPKLLGSKVVWVSRYQHILRNVPGVGLLEACEFLFVESNPHRRRRDRK